jgi:uncharacterized protein YecT (DUF1311 family)
MSKRVLFLTAVAVVAAIASVAVVQADGGTPAQAGKLSPPPIHEQFAAPGHLLPCTQGDDTTPGLEGCAEHRVLKSDGQIDKLNGSISSELANARMKREFIAAHRAWLTYRNADCDSMSSIYEGGTLMPLADIECIENRNERRIKDLSEFRKAPEK